eukprot:TRINITY_DN10423_c0_g1_i1.p1 TRINITY_DN10423_c0_g1~~TRINITY_DN10423_c0_g1_i1.p1  ORF type:complete len:273 (+),score=54.83 TRINITY_DN10423_c0_g1_i1:56-874(+)
MAAGGRRWALLGLLLAGASAEPSRGGSVLVHCDTTAGDIAIEVVPEWSPRGAERFLDLVRAGFWTDIALFRSIPRFLVQFGIPGDPSREAKERFRNLTKRIRDDPHRRDVPVKHGYVSYAGSGPHSRTTQIFIAYRDLPSLGKSPWETPFGRVVRGIENVHKFYKGYGGKPNQARIRKEGNAYLRSEFPKLDYVRSCAIASDSRAVHEAAGGTAAASRRLQRSEDARSGDMEAPPAKPDRFQGAVFFLPLVPIVLWAFMRRRCSTKRPEDLL